jgi:hypothetical protein
MHQAYLSFILELMIDIIQRVARDENMFFKEISIVLRRWLK